MQGLPSPRSAMYQESFATHTGDFAGIAAPAAFQGDSFLCAGIHQI